MQTGGEGQGRASQSEQLRAELRRLSLPTSRAAPVPQPRAPQGRADASVASGLSRMFRQAQRGAGRVGTDTGAFNVRPSCLPPSCPHLARVGGRAAPKASLPSREDVVSTQSRRWVSFKPSQAWPAPGRSLQGGGGLRVAPCLASASACTVTFDVDLLETPSIFGVPAPSISDP